MAFDIAALRAVAVGLNFDVLGVDVTVTVPGEDAVPARAIWVAPLTELQPGGSSFQIADARRVLAIRRSQVAQLPIGTRIVAPDGVGGASTNWIVDGIDRLEEDHQRVVVRLDPQAP